MRRRPAPFFAAMRGKSRKREQGMNRGRTPVHGRDVNGGTSPVHMFTRGRRAARDSGSVGNEALGSRGNPRASVPTVGVFGAQRPSSYRRSFFPAQGRGRDYRRSSIPAQRAAGFTDAPRIWRSAPVQLPTLPDSGANRNSHAHKKRLVPSRMARGVYLTRGRIRAKSRGEALTQRPGCWSRGQPWHRRQRRRSSCGRARSTRAPRRAWSRPWR